MDDSDLAVAKAMEKEILGGDPFYYPCGCFGVVFSVHKYNADWVELARRTWCRGSWCQLPVPDGCVTLWRKRDGAFITEKEWDAHVYGRE